MKLWNTNKTDLQHKKRRKKVSTGQLILHLLFLIGCIVFIYPVLLTIAVSFSSDVSVANDGYKLIPMEWSIKGYEYAFQNADILRAYIVTIMSSVIGAFLGVFVMLLYAYPLSRKDFKHRNFFVSFAYFSAFLSGGLVPWYIVCTQWLGLGNTFWALVLPHLVNTVYIIILRTFINTNVPNELIEAAKIDSANEWQIFFKIIVPLSKSGIATISLFMLLQFWNDYYLPMMLINESQWYNLQYYLQTMFKNLEVMLSGVLGNNSSLTLADIPQEASRMAMCVLTMGPILVVYPFFQKYFIKGMTMGAVKG